MESDTFKQICNLRYKEGLMKALVLVIEQRHTCLDHNTQALRARLIREIQAEIDKIDIAGV